VTRLLYGLPGAAASGRPFPVVSLPVPKIVPGAYGLEVPVAGFPVTPGMAYGPVPGRYGKVKVCPVLWMVSLKA